MLQHQLHQQKVGLMIKHMMSQQQQLEEQQQLQLPNGIALQMHQAHLNMQLPEVLVLMRFMLLL